MRYDSIPKVNLKGVLNMKQSLIVMTIETGRVTIL